MRFFFLLLFITYCLNAFAQEYTTSYPSVDFSSCSYCRIAKVIVGEENTKVLIEASGQKKEGRWVRFSSWTLLVPYNSGKELSDLRTLDLDIPEIQSYDPSYLSIWNDISEKRKSLQTKVAEIYKENLIENLGSYTLDTRYKIKSNTDEIFSVWLTFGKLPPGVEKITIIELIEGGFEWAGISITNPDNSPKTQWNEVSLKLDWEKNGLNLVEGIYENVVSDGNSSKQNLALKLNTTSDIYDLIYLSGAKDSIWQMGDLKAHISKTASPHIFKALWYKGNKTKSEDLYISFEEGLMKAIWTDGNPEQLFIKLYPTSSDESKQISGTGFAISTDGYIVTNHHVTNEASSIKIRGINGDFSRTYTAKVVVADRNNDLAIVKIDDPSFASLGTIPYVISNSLPDAGSSVFVLGYPLRATMGDEVKLTNGIISSKSGFKGDVTAFQTTVPVQPGNSGGPLFDENGNIIGIVNAKHGGVENASYAIKASYLANLVDLLPAPLKLNTSSTVVGRSLTEQVKVLKNFTYIIEIKE